MKGDRVFVDFTSACVDPAAFPSPQAIDLTRPLDRYIHHGWGPHACIGRPIVETAMAAQLRVFAQLKNLRRAPGAAGDLKSKALYGPVKVYMSEDWSEWVPLPASEFSCCKIKSGTLILTIAMSVQWDGFEPWSPLAEGRILLPKYPATMADLE